MDTKANLLSVGLATTQDDVLASQRLRYQIFAEEQGAVLESSREGIDRDYYDDYCHHLLIREVTTGNVVGSTRILTDKNAAIAGSFYSENEFDLSNLLPLTGNAIEIGRTCIHPKYRNGSGIGTLWQGLARFIEQHDIHYMFGCASVSMTDGDEQVAAIIDHTQRNHLSPEQFRVKPRNPLQGRPSDSVRAKTAMPPLLKAYLKLGAWVGGNASLDPEFNVADLFILMDMNNLNMRYHRHFVQSNEQQRGQTQSAQSDTGTNRRVLLRKAA